MACRSCLLFVPPQPVQHVVTQVAAQSHPAFGGRTSCFPYEEAIADWCDLTELDQSGFKIGGLDTGATKTIFQVLLHSALELSSLSIAERRKTEPGSGRVQVGGSGKLW